MTLEKFEREIISSLVENLHFIKKFLSILSNKANSITKLERNYFLIFLDRNFVLLTTIFFLYFFFPSFFFALDERIYKKEIEIEITIVLFEQNVIISFVYKLIIN